MFTVRIVSRAAIGMGPQLQTALEERVRLRQSQGLRVNLQRAAFSPDSPAFAMSFQHPDLAALEAFEVKRKEEPLILDPGLLREGWRPELWETLVPLTPATPPRYMTRVTILPAPGAGPELASLASERASARAAEGDRVGLLIERAGPHYGALAFATSYASMADIDASWKRMQGDSASKEYVAKVQPLMAATPTREIFEVLVPFPVAE